MTKETWVEIFNQVFAYMEQYPSLRLGQAIHNTVSTLLGDGYGLAGTEVDPFCQDSKIIAYIEAVQNIYNTTMGIKNIYIFPYQAWAESKLAKYPLKYAG